jgi:hypothetical protein
MFSHKQGQPEKQFNRKERIEHIESVAWTSEAQSGNRFTRMREGRLKMGLSARNNRETPNLFFALYVLCSYSELRKFSDEVVSHRDAPSPP